MYDIPKTRTVRFAKSFLPYSLVNFTYEVFLVFTDFILGLFYVSPAVGCNMK